MRRTGIALLAAMATLATLSLPGTPALAQQKSASPGVNEPYRDPDFAGWQRSFESPGREVFDRRRDIVAALAIRPGMAVADVGAGTGAFMALLAEKVGAGGTVIAQDIVPVFVRGLEARARNEGLNNVKTVQGTERDARLPAAAVDLVFVCDTYHHFEYPQEMLASLRAALKPGGRLVIVDFERIPGRSSNWVLGHVRAGREAVVAEVQAAGFRLLESRDLLRLNYFLEFARTD